MPKLLDLHSGALKPYDEQAALAAYAVDTEPESIDCTAAGLGIDFPAFSDGRGLSLATLLRERQGYRGTLRAVGDLIPDVLHYLKRCGFDQAVLPDRFSDNEISGALMPHREYYPASVTEPEPAFSRMRRGA